MVRLLFDPDTQWTFGLQNDPPRLWRFRLLPRHQSGDTRARFVCLGKERTAFFGCLWIECGSVLAAQSHGFEDSPDNYSSGVYAFDKHTLEATASHDAAHCWTPAALDIVLPPGFEHAMAVYEARHGSQVFLALESVDELLVRDLRVRDQDQDQEQEQDQHAWIPRAKVGLDGRVPGKPHGLCWRDGLFMLEQSEGRLSIIQLQH
jgi:hypothetical protein